MTQWIRPETDEAGNTMTVTNQFTTIASGMHWLDESNTWQETVEEFVPVTGGFVATRGQHQVAPTLELSPDLAGAVTVVTADGQTLRSSPSAVIGTVWHS